MRISGRSELAQYRLLNDAEIWLDGLPGRGTFVVYVHKRTGQQMTIQSAAANHALPGAWAVLPGSRHAPVAEPIRRISSVYWVFALLLIFNIASPKAGILFFGIPLTFGYMLLGIFAPVALIGLVRRPTLSPAAAANFFLGYLLAGLIVLYDTVFFSSAWTSVVTYLTIFIILPMIILVAMSSHLEYVSEKDIGTVLKWCVRFVIVWGIMNFVLYALFKHIIEIKYVTVNAGELSSVFDKNNRRGSLMKLISTYNNGNVFGASMIMLAPLYIYFEKSRFWITALLIAVVLSLSRTAWFGLLAIGFLMVATGFIRLSRIYFWISLIGAAGAGVVMMAVLGWDSSKLLDTNLGGRFEQWSDIEISPLGQGSIRVAEILYAGLLRSFGVIGSLVVMVALLFPVVYAALNRQRLSRLRMAAAIGCGGYLLIAFFDAAFIYPPVIVIYLFASAMIYRRGYRLPSSTPLSYHKASAAGPA